MLNLFHEINQINRQIEREVDRRLAKILSKADLLPDTPDNIIDWVQAVRTIRGKPFSFEGRDHLIEIYQNPNRRNMIVKPRQTEITEFAVNWLLYHLVKNPGTIGLYVTDRQKHASVFSRTRVRLKAIGESAILKQLVRKGGNVSLVEFKNGSQLYIYSAIPDFESARSLPVDFLVVDEIQSTNVEALPVVEEALAKSDFGRALYIGTGSITGDPWWKLWHDGDQREWDAIEKKWIPKNPDSKMSSYHITQAMIKNRAEDLEYFRKGYSPRRIANEVNGEWYGGTGRPLQESDMKNLYDKNLAITLPDKVNHTLPIYAGFDWGGGNQAYTVAWIWQLVNEAVPRFKLLNAIRIDNPSTEAQADMAIELIRKYEVDQVVMDGGGGMRQVEKLTKQFGPRAFKCNYRYDSINPVEILRSERRVNCDRTWLIETIVDLIKTPEMTETYKDGVPRVHIPYADPSKIDWITDNFTCIEAYTADSGGKNIVKYDHGAETNDDALHAAGYAYLAWVVHMGQGWSWVRIG